MKLKNGFHGQMSDKFRAAVFIILSGGFQDAYTYCCRGSVFANAQTGNIVLMSTALVDADRSRVIKYLIPVVSFIIGIAIAEVVHMRFKNYEKIHWRQLILIDEIVLLFAVGFMPQKLDPLANALVSFVCALQVQTFHKVRGHAYASTMCIGNMRSGVESLSVFLRTGCKEDRKRACHYFGMILTFAAGAGIGGVLAEAAGRRLIWLSCILLTVGFLLMFLQTERTLKE